ncbi:hypothetical protein F230042K4_05180 [Mediterraneibacter glycyrrhizinilyticus]|uniref:DUF3783 domain-containing protein n=1 Tax=Mediterraneibacter glycyrrhizinilyticus TaxID=342942 RepID=UPI000E3FBDD6|nr:DUF3783 domain-containing protein [Lachnospiraceae bacterium AM23-2LB]RJW01743.1 DUF3783 domain-containing protein [Lachnospiraceae bacterium AM40-2BH]
MKETILLFNLTNKQTRRKVELALFPLKLRLRYIPKDQYSQPLGALAGLGDVPPCEARYEGEELPDTMLVFAGLSDARLNQVLSALRRSKAGIFPYKAILTPTNQFWTAPECFAEISKEHELMHAQAPSAPAENPEKNLPKN